MTRTELTELVIKAQKGDNSAIEQIYTLTHNSAYNKIYSSLNNPMDAEDILQNCYLTIIEKIADLKEPESFEKWFNTIIANKIKDHKKKKAPIFLDESEYNALSNSHEENPELIPHENLERTDNIEAIRNLINELSDKNRQAIEMFYFKNKSISEIAKELNVSENAVKARLHNGRNEIKKKAKINAKKILITILVFILLAIITVFSVSGSNEIISKIIYKIQNGFAEFSVGRNYRNGAPETIEEIYAPSYIPDGYEIFDKPELAPSEIFTAYYEYYRAGDAYLTFDQNSIDISGTVATTNTVTRYLIVGKNKILCSENDLMSIYFWENEKYLFTLSTNKFKFSDEEITKIIEGIVIDEEQTAIINSLTINDFLNQE